MTLIRMAGLRAYREVDHEDSAGTMLALKLMGYSVQLETLDDYDLADENGHGAQVFGPEGVDALARLAPDVFALAMGEIFL